ncbi:hypothetical protein AmaxDRAFT_1167 [Limnospira maxima CS-328]|uniref:Uncharacterized protein n=1 Tax=Limnospira maxima CS-328 TaxID=513049 RepID=B5VXC5_LIMMA|nr:hypothetical protein AmaxDRAFT_1167 [Limnospira maxima CS-328]
MYGLHNQERFYKYMEIQGAISYFFARCARVLRGYFKIYPTEQ